MRRSRATCTWPSFAHSFRWHINRRSSPPSLSAQVILRGSRSAGYGFVALATAEAAQKAVEALDKKELDGRQVIVEVAKPSEQKDKEKKEKKAKRRTGRRGSKAVPGEVSEAEANGDAPKADAAAALESDEVAKPKKKKKTKAVRRRYFVFCVGAPNFLVSSLAQAQGRQRGRGRR